VDEWVGMGVGILMDESKTWFKGLPRAVPKCKLETSKLIKVFLSLKSFEHVTNNLRLSFVS
jgi:hypothetical protein